MKLTLSWCNYPTDLVFELFEDIFEFESKLLEVLEYVLLGFFGKYEFGECFTIFFGELFEEIGIAATYDFTH